MVTCLDISCLYIVWVVVAGPDHESLSQHIKVHEGLQSLFYYLISVCTNFR